MLKKIGHLLLRGVFVNVKEPAGLGIRLKQAGDDGLLDGWPRGVARNGAF